MVTIESIPIVAKAVDVAVFAGQYHRTGWTANGIGTKCVVKANALACQAVNMGSFDDFGPISTHRGRSVIIAINEQNVWRPGSFSASGQTHEEEQGGELEFHSPKVANLLIESLR